MGSNEGREEREHRINMLPAMDLPHTDSMPAKNETAGVQPEPGRYPK